MEKKYFQVKNCKIAGTSYSEIYKKAWQIYLSEKQKSKRRPYIRSAYFKKDKIFLNIFWSHLKEKRKIDRERRIRFYKCALELLKNNRTDPAIFNSNNTHGKLYRFKGMVNNNEIFFVQVKENNRGNKFLISIFPEK
jgi:hypothetical protein